MRQKLSPKLGLGHHHAATSARAPSGRTHRQLPTGAASQGTGIAVDTSAANASSADHRANAQAQPCGSGLFRHRRTDQEKDSETGIFADGELAGPATAFSSRNHRHADRRIYGLWCLPDVVPTGWTMDLHETPWSVVTLPVAVLVFVYTGKARRHLADVFRLSTGTACRNHAEPKRQRGSEITRRRLNTGIRRLGVQTSSLRSAADRRFIAWCWQKWNLRLGKPTPPVSHRGKAIRRPAGKNRRRFRGHCSCRTVHSDCQAETTARRFASSVPSIPANHPIAGDYRFPADLVDRDVYR